MLLTAMTILMESCTSEGSLLQLVLLLWPKIDRVLRRVRHALGENSSVLRTLACLEMSVFLCPKMSKGDFKHLLYDGIILIKRSV